METEVCYMKTRPEIKDKAKWYFNQSYWTCVGTFVLAMVTIGAASGVTTGIGAIILGPPIMVGLSFFALSAYRGQVVNVELMFRSGFDNFGRKLGGMLWMQLFTFLWSLLFIIPGIIKSLAYFATPYILADCPKVPATQAIKLSMRMMQGHKGELFVMILSFIGWGLLSGLTAGILEIFYVGPYCGISFAGYFEELKNNAITTGVINASELY